MALAVTIDFVPDGNEARRRSIAAMRIEQLSASHSTVSTHRGHDRGCGWAARDRRPFLVVRRRKAAVPLWQRVPTPATAATASERTITRILIRRLDAATVLQTLRQKPLSVAPGTTEAACAHNRTVSARLRLVNQQIKQAHRALDGLCAKLETATLCTTLKRQTTYNPNCHTAQLTASL